MQINPEDIPPSTRHIMRLMVEGVRLRYRFEWADFQLEDPVYGHKWNVGPEARFLYKHGLIDHDDADYKKVVHTGYKLTQVGKGALSALGLMPPAHTQTDTAPRFDTQ